MVLKQHPTPQYILQYLAVRGLKPYVLERPNNKSDCCRQLDVRIPSSGAQLSHEKGCGRNQTADLARALPEMESGILGPNMLSLQMMSRILTCSKQEQETIDR